jgi:hypothetical protein
MSPFTVQLMCQLYSDKKLNIRIPSQYVFVSYLAGSTLVLGSARIVPRCRRRRRRRSHYDGRRRLSILQGRRDWTSLAVHPRIRLAQNPGSLVRGGPVRRWLEVQVRTLDGHTQLPTGFEHLKQVQTVSESTKCCVLNARLKIADWTIMLLKTLIRDKFSKLYISPRDSVRGYGSNFKEGPATSQRLVTQNS